MAAASSGQATKQPQRWVGELYATKTRSNEWLAAGYRARGDFRFTLANNGELTGHAVVTYEPVVDLSGANQMVNYAKGIGAATIGVIPGITAPAIGALALNGLMGVSYTLPNPMPVQEGPITGSLEDNRLKLEWANGKPLQFPVKFYAEYLNKKKTVTKQSFPADSPWPGTARVSEDTKTLHAIAKRNDRNKKGDVTETNSIYWGAHRASPS